MLKKNSDSLRFGQGIETAAALCKQWSGGHVAVLMIQWLLVAAQVRVTKYRLYYM
jgi:hypothetical protein